MSVRLYNGLLDDVESRIFLDQWFGYYPHVPFLMSLLGPKWFTPKFDLILYRIFWFLWLT